MNWSEDDVKAIIPRATWWLHQRYGIDVDRSNELVVVVLGKMYNDPPPPHVPFAACLFRRLAFAARSFWRKENQLRWVDLPEDEYDTFASHEPSCEDLLLKQERAHESITSVKAIQRKLRHKDFKVLWLAHTEDLTSKQIAEILGSTDSAVRQALKRARDRARAKVH